MTDDAIGPEEQVGATKTTEGTSGADADCGCAMTSNCCGLGLLASLGSCCNYAIWVALAGFAASREETRRRDSLLLPLGFLVGSTLFMAARSSWHVGSRVRSVW